MYDDFSAGDASCFVPYYGQGVTWDCSSQYAGVAFASQAAYEAEERIEKYRAAVQQQQSDE